MSDYVNNVDASGSRWPMPKLRNLTQDDPGIPMQSPAMSLVEVLANVAVGFVFAMIVQALVFPLIGLKVTLGENLLIGAAFTGASVIRGYVLRRLFERIRIGGLQRDAAALLRTAARVGLWMGQLPMR